MNFGVGTRGDCFRLRRSSLSTELISRDELCVRVNITGSTNPVIATYIDGPWNLISIKETGRCGARRGQTMRTWFHWMVVRGPWNLRLFRRQPRNRSAMNYLGVTWIPKRREKLYIVFLLRIRGVRRPYGTWASLAVYQHKRGDGIKIFSQACKTSYEFNETRNTKDPAE